MDNRLGLAERDVDVRSHAHLLTDMVSPRTMLATGVEQAGTVISTLMNARFTLGRKHRAWQMGDQGPYPRCTAYGTVTMMECAPVTVKKQNLFDVAPAFYNEIWAIDRAEGRFYSEGATTVAAMKAAMARGWIGSYAWEFQALEPAHAFLVSVGPFIAGTNWYPSMFNRDSEGVIRIASGSAPAGGHLYCVNGYDAMRDLWRIANTWGDGVYWIGSSDLERLVRENGEFCFPRELPQTMWKVAA